MLCKRINLMILFLGLFQGSCALVIPESCPNATFSSIPSDHLYHKKEKPLIIAHRGQPKVYQENTFDSIISTLGINADGYELDIYLTKDQKLVVFHDQDTEALTGIKKTVWNSTYEELSKLNIRTNVTKGGKTYTYDKPRKIPLLEDILNATKQADMIHYLEIKPEEPVTDEPDGLAENTGRLVADMVTKYNLERKAIVVSFDYRKTYFVKQRNPKITIGTLYDIFSKSPKSFVVEHTFKNLTKCLNDAPTDSFEFLNFVLQSGILYKYSGSASFDADIKLYNNPKYSNNTISMLRKNYKNDISTGFYTVYSMSKTEEENQQDEIRLKALLGEGGGCRIITDDVPRVMKFLGRNQISSSTLPYHLLYGWSIVFHMLMLFYV